MRGNYRNYLNIIPADHPLLIILRLQRDFHKKAIARLVGGDLPADVNLKMMQSAGGLIRHYPI